MDRSNLIAGLANAFAEDEKYVKEEEKKKDVEYKADTNTLLINKEIEAQILEKKDAELKPMSEEELFARLHNERRNG